MIGTHQFVPKIKVQAIIVIKQTVVHIVMRGGYGVYYDRISTRYANTQLFNYPYFFFQIMNPLFFF